MVDIELYRDRGLEIYEKVHYSHGEHVRETEKILSWYRYASGRILDIGCSGGLHAVELAKRGFSVTGIDREVSAVGLAAKRSLELRLEVDFFVVDLEKDDLSRLGRFDLVICIGNVISHLVKKSLLQVLKKIRTCLTDNGIFLFDFLIVGDRFPEEVSEEELGIVWWRKLDRSSGEITLTGFFKDYGVTAKFGLWGYTREEMVEMLKEAGYAGVEFSGGLEFHDWGGTLENPVCLRCRAHAKPHATAF